MSINDRFLVGPISDVAIYNPVHLLSACRPVADPGENLTGALHSSLSVVGVVGVVCMEV